MNNLFSLAGKTALITGASSGLGAHFAKLMAKAGARVIATARRTDRLNALVEEITQSGGTVMATPMNVTDGESVRQAFDAAEATFGTPDIVVCNAGIAEGRAFVDIDEASWDQMMDTNLKGVWLTAREGTARLIKAGKPGSIINMASILGIGVQTSTSHYGTSKAAVLHLTRTMANEMARHKIRVNALAPGYIQTELNTQYLESETGQKFIKGIPARRLGTLEELDGPLLLLASDASSYMSGAIIVVDGGHMVKSL